MPDWILTVPRLVWAPIRWAGRRVRRYAVDRQVLVQQGSEVVTPVIQFTKGLGPTSIMWGTFEQNRDYLQGRYAKWPALRDNLMTYVNRHPSDQVRSLGEEVELAVAQDLSTTEFLLGSQRSEYAHDAYKASDRAHKDSLQKTERLMKAIRSY